MIVFFGPAGAGKSMQGHVLAARHGWRWTSTGQMLRDSKDKELMEVMRTGALVSDEIIDKIVVDALKDASDVSNVILDGYPRNIKQAENLLSTQDEHGHSIEIALIIEVPRAEIVKRLMLRGRADDTPEVIDKRIGIFKKEIYPILGYLTEKGIPVVHIDGSGTVGQVHDRIEEELVGRGIVKEA